MDTVIWIASGGAGLLYAAIVPFAPAIRLGLLGLGLLAIFIGIRVAVGYLGRLTRIKRAGHSLSAWSGADLPGVRRRSRP